MAFLLIPKDVFRYPATQKATSYPARRYPHEFSGGQRQRISIARALTCMFISHNLSVVEGRLQ